MNATTTPALPRDSIELIINHIEAYRDVASIPAEAIAAAKMFAFDSIGVALSGASVPQSTLLLNAVRTWGVSKDAADNARVWGSDEMLPAPSAALVNAFHIHNQEFDCVHERAVVHPMAVILAALVAVAERMGNVSGARLLGALVIAVDVAAVIGMSATKPIRFFRPAQCGCLGAIAGIAWLMQMQRDEMRDAFGLGYSQLAGTMQAHIEGTPTLALQVGFAARAAVCAADLAKQGFRGPHHVLDGKHGYFALYETDASPTEAFAQLGKVWQITKVSHKPFPTGRAAHGGIAGLRTLMREHGFQAADVQSVVLSAPPLIRQLVDRPMLQSGVGGEMNVSYARLCLPYLAAVTLMHGTVTLDAYQPHWFRDPALLALAQRVSLVADGNADVNALAPQHLQVTLLDGRVLDYPLPHVYGAPQWPMTDAEQRDKFVHCCLHAKVPLDATKQQRLMTAIDEMTEFNDIRALFALTV
jgi:aconitate decarboxylase